MSAATVLFALLFYVATAALVAGLAWRIADYARTPAPLKIPTTRRRPFLMVGGHPGAR